MESSFHSSDTSSYSNPFIFLHLGYAGKLWIGSQSIWFLVLAVPVTVYVTYGKVSVLKLMRESKNKWKWHGLHD